MPETKGDGSKGARANNRRRVLDLLRQREMLTQAEIVSLTGLSRATVSAIVTELRARGLAQQAGRDTSVSGQTGRPRSVIALSEAVGGVIGIEFDHSYIRAMLGNLGLDPLMGPLETPMDVAHNASSALEAAATMVNTLLTKAEMPRSRVIGVGLSLPAPIRRDPNPQQSTVNTNTILPDWVGRQPAAEMAKLLGLPTLVENDANLGALAEFHSGAAKGCANVVYIKASTGIGCGLILDRRLYRGEIGTAGELAHVVVEPNGAICYCGNRGCLHTVVGAGAISRLLQTSDVGPALARPLDSRTGGSFDQHLIQVINEATRGDLGCQRALEDAAEALGIAVAGLCNVLNPKCVVIGGVLGTAGDLIFQPLSRAVTRYTSSLSGEIVMVLPSSWQQQAEMMGALTLARKESSPEMTNRLNDLFDELSRPAKRSRSSAGNKRSTERRRGNGSQLARAE